MWGNRGFQIRKSPSNLEIPWSWSDVVSPWHPSDVPCQETIGSWANADISGWSAGGRSGWLFWLPQNSNMWSLEIFSTKTLMVILYTVESIHLFQAMILNHRCPPKMMIIKVMNEFDITECTGPFDPWWSTGRFMGRLRGYIIHFSYPRWVHFSWTFKATWWVQVTNSTFSSLPWRIPSDQWILRVFSWPAALMLPGVWKLQTLRLHRGLRELGWRPRSAQCLGNL